MLKEFYKSELFNDQLNLVNADANKMPFESEIFDLCFSFSSVCYFKDFSILLNNYFLKI